MSVPPPPPRVVEPSPTPEPTNPQPVADLPPAPPSRPARPATREKEQPKAPETKPPETAPEPVPPPPTAPAAAPAAGASPLRTPQTANDSDAARNVRVTIDRARNLLGSVNFGLLSDERKKAYNDAKMFLDQADAALGQGNYVFAQGVASKGEALARELSGK